MKTIENLEAMTTVKEDDLNGIDGLNSSASVNTKDGLPALNDDGTMLKGALSKLSIYQGQLRALEEQQWIQTTKNQLFDLQAMNFKYNNLPEELDIIRIETKPFENGSAAWIRVFEKLFVVNYSIEEFNLYEEPTQIKVLEPKAPAIDGKIFTIGNNCSIFRNNPKMISFYQKAYRFLKGMEKTLFQIEKNLTASAPKGLINPKNNKLSTSFEEDNENPMQNSLELIANGQNTFYVLKAGDDINAMQDDNPIWIPMELTDRTENLIKNYTFFKEQLKELLGESQNIHQKKERVNTEELEQQKGLAEKTKLAMFETRRIDIERINKVFGTNIQIELVEDEEEEPKENMEDGGNDE